jgi:hypothetical protein
MRRDNATRLELDDVMLSVLSVAPDLPDALIGHQ